MLKTHSLLLREWRMLRTQLLWRWRFRHLGSRTVVGRHGDARHAAAVAIGHHVFLDRDWHLVDLNPSADRHQPPRIRIGAWCRILYGFHCNAALSVEIQDYVLIGPRVMVTDSDHVVDPQGSPTATGTALRSAPVVIEHNCWIGVNAVVLKGVRIGHHSIVGANAVLTSSAPPCSILAGVPARVIGSTAPAGGGGLPPPC